MKFTFAHSHAFPNGTVDVEDDGDQQAGCLVAFGDGTTIMGAWHRDGGDIVLDVPSYKTAKGTKIAPHRWRLKQGTEGRWRSRREVP